MAGRRLARAFLGTPRGMTVRAQLAQEEGALLRKLWDRGPGRAVLAMERARDAARAGRPRTEITALKRDILRAPAWAAEELIKNPAAVPPAAGPSRPPPMPAVLRTRPVSRTHQTKTQRKPSAPAKVAPPEASAVPPPSSSAKALAAAESARKTRSPKKAAVLPPPVSPRIKPGAKDKTATLTAADIERLRLIDPEAFDPARAPVTRPVTIPVTAELIPPPGTAIVSQAPPLKFSKDQLRAAAEVLTDNERRVVAAMQSGQDLRAAGNALKLPAATVRGIYQGALAKLKTNLGG